MRSLDRSLIAWSQGNFVGSLGLFNMTSEWVFFAGNPVALRMKDLGGKPFIARLVDVPNQPIQERHLKGRDWFHVMPCVAREIHERLSRLQRARKERIPFEDMQGFRLFGIGQDIKELYSIFSGLKRKINLLVEPADEYVMAVRLLYRGQVEAITYTPEHVRGPYDLRAFRLHRKMDDAILEKMRNDDVTLYEV